MAQYTQRTQPMHSHLAWLQQNIKQNIISIDDTITICQLHLDFGTPSMLSQPVQPSQTVQSLQQPLEQKRPTATKSVQHTSKQCKNREIVIEVPPPETQNTKLYKILSEPGTSKRKDMEDIELFYRNSDIERQIVDVEASLSAHTVKKSKISHKECEVVQETSQVQEVQVISDDDDDVVEIKTEIFPANFEEVDDHGTKSGNGIDQIADDEIVLTDGKSVFRTNISINPDSGNEDTVYSEPEDNIASEEELILPDVHPPTGLKDPFKQEPEDEETDLENGSAAFNDEESQLERIKVENSDSTIDIGETVIQEISTGNNELDNIFLTLVEKNLLTVADRKHLSTISFDIDCILNRDYKFNDNIKEFAQQLYLCSEEAYNYMVNYIPCLPSVERIKQTFITLKGEPGFSKEALDCLKMKVKLKKTTRYIFCSLAINDIELKAPETREKHRVAFIITAVALSASWKLPICYFISSDLMSSKKRELLIRLAISLVEHTGVFPKAVSFLPIFQNIEMAGRLVKDKNKNYMFLSFSGKEIYLIPDPVYIIDKYRICGCEDKNGQLISLRHIELLVKHLGRVQPGKVTNRLLGKSITHTLKVCADDFLSSGLANVSGTVYYLTLINKFLDIMTSHSGGTSDKEVVRGKTFTKVLLWLEFFQEYLLHISPKYRSNPFWLSNTLNRQIKFDTTSVMNVLRMAALGAHDLIEQLFLVLKGEINDLSMKKLTMSSTTFLTNFYNVIDNGLLTEQTVEEFTTRYKHNFQFMKPHAAKKGYILPIENISVLDITSPVQRINVTTYLLNSNNVTINNQFDIDTRDDLYKILKYDARSEYSNLSKIYIAGYVVYNLVRRLRCDTCISALIRSNQLQPEDPYNGELVITKSEQDSSNKLCVKLMDPSVDVVRICKATDVVIMRAMTQSKAEKLDVLERYGLSRLMLKIRKDMIGRNYFKTLNFHRHDTDTLENHVVELAKAVAEVYLEIRLKYRTPFLAVDF